MITLHLEDREVDLLAHRLTAGEMPFQTAMAVAALLNKIQQQANPQQAPAPSTPAAPKE